MTEDELLLREAETIVTAVGRMFPGLCEVVLHDLRDPEHAIRAIENNESGRAVGDPATELGIARIQDPAYPNVVQNYPNTFPDGRPAKSTSIGIRNSAGEYVAAICLNLDVSLFATVARSLRELVRTEEREQSVTETLRARTSVELRSLAEEFAAERGRAPHALDSAEKRRMVRFLRDEGFLDVKNAVRTLTGILGVSRATVYNYLK
ncbi:transcriptional regulator [Streptomyces sp. NP-1717]|uniref:helix-turn-helix transcriptional regulator n=1 Tax=Streptomyces sp. NP-1717 TaxID=2704470 RepID=UPI001F5D7DFB|nr:PAS domain-containing protein [Streptomyces sp. NP-1717]MCI3221562.1 transcriptional regulator [Streptomyces sp. NP-1717]